MTYSPSAFDSTAGLDLSPFDELTPRQRRLLAVLLARVSERAYRRGAQQGATFAATPGRLHGDLHDWRYEAGTDAAPSADTHVVDTSLERLLIEEPQLRTIIPTEAEGVGQIDMDEAVGRLRDASAAYSAVFARRGPDREQRLASAAIRAIGLELMAVGGYRALGDAYDELVERHGHEAARGVESSWTGIGTWSA